MWRKGAQFLADEALESVLRRVASQDRAAFRLLYDQTSGKTLAVVLSIVRDRNLAEDVLQETYLQVWSSAAKYDRARGSPMAWLTTMARSRAIDRIRKDRRGGGGNVGDANTDLIPDPNPTAEDSAALSEDTRRLADCMTELSDNQRHCIRLAFWHGYTHSELAEHLNAPLGSVKSWIRRGLLQLDECLGR